MKKIITLSLSIILLALTGCKTTEANYRAAYEKAKTKGQSTAVDQSVYDQIDREEGPATLTFDGVSFPGRAMYLGSAQVDGIPTGKINRFSIATASFKQVFNAKSMVNRLKENGFDQAFLAKDREGNFVVVVNSVETAPEAAAILDTLSTMKVGAVKPFPYVMVRP